MRILNLENVGSLADSGIMVRKSKEIGRILKIEHTLEKMTKISYSIDS